MPEQKRKRGRPPGAKNRPKASGVGLENAGAAAVQAPTSSVEPPRPDTPVAIMGQTRIALEADRDRLLRLVDDNRKEPCEACHRVGDPKMEAILQSQLNGVHRMLLRITGETAPTDANLVRSPQYARIKAELVAVLKKHPAALADVVAIFDTAEQ